MNIYGTSTQETESLSHVGINEKQVHRKLDFLDHVVNQSLEKKSIDSHLRNKYIGSWISQAYMNIYKYIYITCICSLFQKDAEREPLARPMAFTYKALNACLHGLLAMLCRGCMSHPQKSFSRIQFPMFWFSIHSYMSKKVGFLCTRFLNIHLRLRNSVS